MASSWPSGSEPTWLTATSWFAAASSQATVAGGNVDADAAGKGWLGPTIGSTQGQG